MEGSTALLASCSLAYDKVAVCEYVHTARAAALPDLPFLLQAGAA